MKKAMLLSLLILSFNAFASIELSKIRCEGRIFEHGFYTSVPLNLTSGGAATSDYLMGKSADRIFFIGQKTTSADGELIVNMSILAAGAIEMSEDVTLIERDGFINVKSKDGQYAIECVF